jgi:hypothetical protein
MTVVKLCIQCGVHEVEADDLCRFCLVTTDDEEYDPKNPIPVDAQMRRSVGRRISEGWYVEY